MNFYRVKWKNKNDESGVSKMELVKLNYLFYMFVLLFIIRSLLNFLLVCFYYIIEDLKYIVFRNNLK